MASLLDSPATKPVGQADMAQGMLDATAEKFEYDVFISYSHRNPTQAEQLLKIFNEIDSEVKVFYDRSELTAGNEYRHGIALLISYTVCSLMQGSGF